MGIRSLWLAAVGWPGVALAAPNLTLLDLSTLDGQSWLDVRSTGDGFIVTVPSSEGARWYRADLAGNIAWADVFDCPGPDGDGQIVLFTEAVVCVRGDVISAYELASGAERFRVGGASGYLSAAAAGDRLYVTTPSAVESWDIKRGKLAATWDVPLATVHDLGGPAALMAGDTDVSLIRLDPKVKSRKVLARPEDVWAAPGMVVHAGPALTLLRGVDGQLSGLETGTGRLAWHGGGFNQDTWPVGANLITRVAAGDGHLAVSALDPATRWIRWTVDWPIDDLPWGMVADGGSTVISGSRHWKVIDESGAVLGSGDVADDREIMSAAICKNTLVIDALRIERGGKRGRRVISASTRGHEVLLIPLSGGAPAPLPAHTVDLAAPGTRLAWFVTTGVSRDAAGVLLDASGDPASGALEQADALDRPNPGANGAVVGQTWHRVMWESAAGALPLDLLVDEVRTSDGRLFLTGAPGARVLVRSESATEVRTLQRVIPALQRVIPGR
jgi:hypothetical protein